MNRRKEERKRKELKRGTCLIFEFEGGLEENEKEDGGEDGKEEGGEIESETGRKVEEIGTECNKGGSGICSFFLISSKNC